MPADVGAPSLQASGELILAVDASTTACKAIVFDGLGRTHGEGRAPIGLSNPEPDAYEQDAEEWWAAARSAMKAAVASIGADNAARIRAVALTHQRETFVLTDAHGQPLRPGLVWMDARCRRQVARAVNELGKAYLHELTGKPACTTPSFYKLLFLFEAHPELRGAPLRVLDVGAFLTWRMTGLPRTSLASADPLGLVDMERRTWSPALLDFLGVSADSMPELVAPGEVLGMLDPALCGALGLPGPVPLIATAGDGQAAGLGAGITEPGRAYLNLGTAIVSGVLAKSYRVDEAFRTLYGAAPNTFFLETDLKGGTFTVNWLVDKWLGARQDGSRSVEQALADLETEAARLPPGADGLVLVPYWNGVMNPYWDDDATGLVIGWHGAHGPAHLYRALLEGIAFEQRLNMSGLELASVPIHELVVMGGGAKSELWCQIIADVLGRPIVRTTTHEASALGAAISASVAVGLHSSVASAVAAMTRTAGRFVPGGARAHYSRLYEEVYRELFPRLCAQLGALSRIRAEQQGRLA
jgi:xylulokinase